MNINSRKTATVVQLGQTTVLRRIASTHVSARGFKQGLKYRSHKKKIKSNLLYQYSCESVD